ncbi:hypothetical protein [Streptomyces sp. SID3915]|uniref:hypothetical protein n=1 Tax=Streptomyces sp. SID3915 TaxID=2690263 RepID=UPI00136D7471|nr:hypothetical protein [Streptomyces sp. SID3915]
MDVAPRVDVADEEAVGASVVGGPCGDEGPVTDPGVPGIVLPGDGGSVGVSSRRGAGEGW